MKNEIYLLGPETTTLLQSQDHQQFYRKKYKETTVVKNRRVINNNEIIKDSMEKQRQDDKRGMTYGSGVALESDTIPEFIKVAENKKQELLGVYYLGQQEQISVSIMA